MNSQLLMELVSVSVIASVISSQLIQKMKKLFDLGSLFNKILSVIISISVGFMYSYTFYTDNIIYSLWIGLFTLVGAESLYKTFKGKFGFSSSTKIK